VAGGNPASWVVEAIRTAGPAREVRAYAPANCSAWALREAGAEIALGESIAREQRRRGLEPGEDDLEGRFTAESIAALCEQADYVEEHAELPAADEVDDFDADLRGYPSTGPVFGCVPVYSKIRSTVAAVSAVPARK
jgi:hypothetical protein